MARKRGSGAVDLARQAGGRRPLVPAHRQSDSSHSPNAGHPELKPGTQNLAHVASFADDDN